MLMWGPLKDTVKEGFSVRRQAEKQQTVYRLILFCAPKLVAASCKAPPSFFLLCAPQPPPPPPPHISCISCSSVRHGGIPRTETDLFSSPSSFFTGLMNVLTLLFTFCYTLLCIFVLPVPFSTLWQTLNIIVTRDISHFYRLFGLFLGFISVS